MGTQQVPSKPPAILGPPSPKLQNWVPGTGPQTQSLDRGHFFFNIYYFLKILFGCAGPHLQHAGSSDFTEHTGSLVVAYKPLVAAYGT